MKSKSPLDKMEKVVFAADCEECPDCGEPWCERHKAHYADCACIGPTEEDVAYQEIDGVLYGRRQNQNGS